LIAINNEAKTRRSTKSTILAKGAGVVISYEHLVAARVKRAEKDHATEAKGKGKRGRKRKSAAPDTAADVEAGPSVSGQASQKRKETAPEAEATTAEVEAGPSVPKGKEKRGQKRKSTALEAEGEGGTSVSKGKVAQTSEVMAVEATEVSWRVPIAKTY
jgi:hypothetical protein